MTKLLPSRHFCLARLVCVLLSFLPVAVIAQQANIWHIPGATQDGIPSTMRDPAAPASSGVVTFYQGLWKGDGANQIGGFFVYRVNGGAWQSTLLPPGYQFHSDVSPNSRSHNQFWKASVAMPAQIGATFEYYFIVDSSNRSRTFLYNGNRVTGNESDAQAAPYLLTVSFPRPTVTVNNTSADYSKSNFYIDEVNDTTFPQLTVRLTTNIGPVDRVEVFTNLNNRERANQDYNNDGIEDGIMPVDGNLITSADTGAYFQAYPMTPINENGTYELILPVLETGAYRLTARYRLTPTGPWRWISESGIRDHAVVVAPNIARDMRVYEIHVTNVNATGPTFAQRGTFEDLHDPTKRVNLDWLRNLGVNWIWFQPFHPQGLDGRQTDPATGQDYEPGSPYSIRNFWEINPLYTRNWNGDLPNAITSPANFATAMQAFQNFATASDQAGVQLMLDFPFNHTAPDVALGAKGLQIFAPPGHDWQPGDLIRDRVPQFFSHNGAGGTPAYSVPAQNASQAAVAPDRNDFGKWNDVLDVFFGRYATLVTGDPSAETSRAIVRNEGDWVDYASMGPVTIGVWRYFGEVLPYWIGQSGHRGFNSTPSDGNGAVRTALDMAGIDGLRKDFGQGLPPQAMEYIINRTHEVKWNFVFMTESLDGEQVTYRSSRHFAVLNENIVFPLQEATTTSAYRSIIEGRRSAYGQSLVLLNNTSHDEVPYSDPWQALIRYATVSTTDGAPMIMYGQEIGTGQKVSDSVPQGGFDWYEFNMNKFIPHFKKWNSMQPQWLTYDANAFGVQFLKPVYAAIGQARASSPALRSSNRWFLNPRNSSSPDPEIFAVAKYTSGNTPLAQQDVVLAFTSLDRSNVQDNTFGVTAELAGILGLQDGRVYNARNIAAYTGRGGEQASRRQQWLWGSGFTRSQMLADGIFVLLNPVPTSSETWSQAPYEAQFLKVYDVTAPTAVAASTQGPNTAAFAVGDSVKFTWSEVPADAAGVVPSYEVIATVNGVPRAPLVVGSANHTVTGVNPGDQVSIEIRTVNPHDTTRKAASAATAQSIRVLSTDGDEDGDGMRNDAEQIAGTNALDANSRLQASVVRSGNSATITWDTAPARSYTVQYRKSLTAGGWGDVAAGLTAGEFTHSDLNELTGFYRVVVE